MQLDLEWNEEVKTEEKESCWECYKIFKIVDGYKGFSHVKSK